MPYAVFRQYTSPALADALTDRADDVRQILGDIAGFRSWMLLVNDTGTLTITVCDTPEGAAESVGRAAEWVKANLPDLQLDPPTVTEAEARMRITPTETLT